ncbi:MAG: hypothetical protein O9972_20245, partial [Burkholderiales bacterium]|nr:hypothetical protein [Burkholderiales bacterium]
AHRGHRDAPGRRPGGGGGAGRTGHGPPMFAARAGPRPGGPGRRARAAGRASRAGTGTRRVAPGSRRE